MSSFLAAYAIRVLLLLVLGVAVDRCLRKKSAALRHLSWTLVLAASLIVAPLSLTMPTLQIPSPGWTAPVEEGVLVPSSPPEDHGTAVPIASPSPEIEVDRALLLLWITGSLILFVRLAGGRFHLARLRRRSLPIPDLTAAIGCPRHVRLLQSPEVATPATFGLFRPVVLLPMGAERWPEDRIRAVLLHELSHVARRDPLPQLLAEVVCLVHWFNPLSWYAARRLAQERERACDDRVLAAGIAAPDYAAHIVDVARLAAASRSPRAALAIAGRIDLESRIRGVLNPAQPRERTTAPQRLRFVLAAAAFAGGLAGLGFVPAPPVDEQSLADPRSEIVPVRDPRSGWPTEDEIRRSADGEALRRLQIAAAHVKTDEGDLVRERAEWALAQAAEGEIVRPLIRALADDDWRVMGYAAWSLGVAGDRRAIAPLRPLLDHPVWRVRAMALSALLDLEATIPSERLALLAKDPAWQVRIEVVEYLQRHRGADASALLRTMAGDPHGGTRMTVEAALAEAGET